MPEIGLGLHVILAVLCAIHAVRTHQNMVWLLILFLFPLLGSVVYVVAIYLPHSPLRRSARQAVTAASRAIDPQREVREARAAFDDMPTAQHQMRLAAALLEVGQPAEAAEQYAQCLRGPFAQDPEIRYGAARAEVECQRHAEALQLLQPLQAERPDYRAQDVALLSARALAGLGRADEARRAFDTAEQRYGTYEAKAEYAIWAYRVGDRTTAERLSAELDKLSSRWGAQTRLLNEPVHRRLQAARAQAGRAA